MDNSVEELDEIRQRIFKRLEKKISQLQSRRSASSLEREPDVIVIEGDLSLLFEAQNPQAWRRLARRCGFPDDVGLPDRIRVRHCRSQQAIKVLKAAGATVCASGLAFPGCQGKNLERNGGNGHNPSCQNNSPYTTAAYVVGNFPKAIHENS